MRTVFKLYKWIIASLILQLILLGYLNFFYLNSNGPIKITSFETAGKNLSDIKRKIPAGALQVKVSFDGSYVGYVLNGSLVINDLKKNEEKKVITDNDNILSYYRWLPDRNMIIYALRPQKGESGPIQVTTYAVDSEVEHKYPKITGAAKNSDVMDIQLSPLTNVVYVKIKISDAHAKIYKFNIMSNLSYITTLNADTIIKETSYSDKLIFQDSRNRIFVRDGLTNSTKQLSFKNKMVLLGFDSEDRLYAGELDSDKKVQKIYNGKLSSKDTTTWDQIALKEPVAVENIFIANNGTLFELRKDIGTLYNIQDSTSINYDGEFIELLNDYIVTLENTQLKLTVMNFYGDEIKK